MGFVELEIRQNFGIKEIFEPISSGKFLWA